jgi:hypothetical protein
MLTPMPITRLSTLPRPSRDDSNRMPATFFPEISISFGHLQVTAVPAGMV